MNFSRNSRGRKGPIDFDLELTVCSYNQIFFPFLARVDCRIYSKIHRAKYFIRKDLIDIFDEERLILFFMSEKSIYFLYTTKQRLEFYSFFHLFSRSILHNFGRDPQSTYRLQINWMEQILTQSRVARRWSGKMPVFDHPPYRRA